MTMVEKVARAMAANAGVIWSGPRGEDDPDFTIMKMAYLRAARAAIEAMREPDDAMVKAGAHGSGEDSETTALGAWQAMIDAALAE